MNILVYNKDVTNYFYGPVCGRKVTLISAHSNTTTTRHAYKIVDFGGRQIIFYV